MKSGSIVQRCAVLMGLAMVATMSAGVVSAGTASAAPAAEHCVGRAVTKADLGKVAPAPACFSTFADAISYATGGTVSLPANATTVTQAQLDSGATKRAMATVIGISFANTGYQGNTYTHTAGSGCDDSSDVDFYFQFPSSWNDETGSARAYSNCAGLYHEHGYGDHGGGASVFTSWSGGVMDDESSFIEWL